MAIQSTSGGQDSPQVTCTSEDLKDSEVVVLLDGSAMESIRKGVKIKFKALNKGHS